MIPPRLRREVLQRANDRCEYCGLSQAGQEAAFHIDHIQPESTAGETTFENLALACVSCSLRKGAAIMAVDPISGQMAALFNPRTQKWADHFQWNDVEIVPLTPIGRATVSRLKLNRPLVLAIREEEKFHHKTSTRK